MIRQTATGDRRLSGDDFYFCAAMAHHTRTVVVFLLAALLAQGVPAATPYSRERVEALGLFTDRCIARVAERLALPAGASVDGLAPIRLPEADDRIARELARSGVLRGALDVSSLLTPPSSVFLVQLTKTPKAPLNGACPLGETYVAFRRGGFSLDTTRYFGPIVTPRESECPAARSRPQPDR